MTQPKKSKRPPPRVGDRCWIAEWVYELAYEEPGDPESGIDWDNCKSHRRRADSYEEAKRIAREVLPQAVGSVAWCQPAVEIYPMEFVPYDEADAAAMPTVGYWEVTADPEYYDGEAE